MGSPPPPTAAGSAPSSLSEGFHVEFEGMRWGPFASLYFPTVKSPGVRKPVVPHLTAMTWVEFVPDGAGTKRVTHVREDRSAELRRKGPPPLDGTGVTFHLEGGQVRSPELVQWGGSAIGGIMDRRALTVRQVGPAGEILASWACTGVTYEQLTGRDIDFTRRGPDHVVQACRFFAEKVERL